MFLFDSHIEGGQYLSQREKERYYTILIEYMQYGKEPDYEKGGPAIGQFVSNKPTIDKYLARAAGGVASGVSRRKKASEQNRNESDDNVQSDDKQTDEQTDEQTPNKVRANSRTNSEQTPEQNSNKPGTNPQTKEQRTINKEISPTDVGDIKKSARRFKPPSVDEVRDYVREKGYSIDPEQFIDYYTEVGWVVGNGRKPMKDWQSAVRNWQRREGGGNAATPGDNDEFMANAIVIGAQSDGPGSEGMGGEGKAPTSTRAPSQDGNTIGVPELWPG